MPLKTFRSVDLPPRCARRCLSARQALHRKIHDPVPSRLPTDRLIGSTVHQSYARE